MTRKPIAKKKKRKALMTPPKSNPNWVAVGLDVSMSSIAGAAIAWDEVLKRMVGPVFVERRWRRNVHYFERLNDAARAHLFIQDLIAKLVMTPKIDEIHIAIEEPVPLGMMKRGNSGWVKQQCQISGAVLGALVRYGYMNVYEINNTTWKKPIAEDLEITLRHPDLKFLIKTWAIQEFPNVPDWEDLIDHSKHGLIPRPEGSKAKARQPDDRYDACGIMSWMQTELENIDG